ncbi:hypothetical protein, partial [Faecousia sp.]|uniref:hypothetical protein n=1 Tax=Faecousia sp. TaxID=2952921 RepID=UPI002EB38C0B|nr:hypothetical protein [Oscillospiraceae bacterium]
PPIHRFEKLEIHKVFLHFSNLDLTENLSPSTLADLIRASLNFPGCHHLAAGLILWVRRAG